MDRLLLYHDFASPFSRLAVPAVSEAARRTGMELRPVPFEIRPAPAPLPAPGEPDDGELADELADELATARSLAVEWGLELGTLRRVPRTRKAHEAVAFARVQGAGLPMLRALYDALWLDGLDIARLDVLADVGEAAGLDREALHVALGVDDFEAEVVREQEAAVAAGLTGVPAVQVSDVVATGLFPAHELVEWIEQNR